jgi:hypothetical protein
MRPADPITALKSSRERLIHFRCLLRAGARAELQVAAPTTPLTAR